MRDFLRVVIACLLIAGSAFVSQAEAQQSPQTPDTSSMQQGSPADKPQSSSQTLETQAANEALSPESQDRLVREIRHELVMLPYYGVFDNLAFSLNGRNVTLTGQVVNPSTKSGAGNVVKHIEGVENVTNNIEVLPPSSMDDRIRQETYRSIYSYGPLFKYGNMAVPPIHIIVKNARITLDGVVDSEGDKNVAGMRANIVPGTFGVTNNLRVINPSGENNKKK